MPMGKILCATRGGEASFRAQDRAISLAKERGDELIFLYVVDLAFLDKKAALVINIKESMDKMGEFLLIMAQERAEAQGVQARALLREGKVRQEIKAAASEESVALVVLGRPVREDGSRIFALEDLQNFAAELEAETGAEVVIV
ncbi:MAG TPA: universal stress protein [Anaerolineae bacterium]|nr:universal stress protein [Anaerolineae bacterium]